MNAERAYILMITIVSGLPRSGTSLMMQMLVAGGLTPLSDGERQADTDNPKGYLEWERVKQLPKEPSLIAEAEGKVVKVISQLLLSLPKGHDYRVIFMQRPSPEVLASQEQMLVRRGTKNPAEDMAIIGKAFEKHLQDFNTWLARRPDVKLLRVPYHEVLNGAADVAGKISRFLGVPLNEAAMLQQVDGSLYRNRASKS